MREVDHLECWAVAANRHVDVVEGIVRQVQELDIRAVPEGTWRDMNDVIETQVHILQRCRALPESLVIDDAQGAVGGIQERQGWELVEDNLRNFTQTRVGKVNSDDILISLRRHVIARDGSDG